MKEVDGNKCGYSNQEMRSAFDGALADFENRFDDDGDDDGLESGEYACD